MKKGLNMLQKIKKVLKVLLLQVTSNFKMTLPVGLTEFEQWAQDIIVLSKAPDNDSVRFALASIIINLKHDQPKQSKKYCAGILIKGMATQVASSVFHEMKVKQAEAAKAASEAAQKAEIESGLQK